MSGESPDRSDREREQESSEKTSENPGRVPQDAKVPGDDRGEAAAEAAQDDAQGGGGGSEESAENRPERDGGSGRGAADATGGENGAAGARPDGSAEPAAGSRGIAERAASRSDDGGEADDEAEDEPATDEATTMLRLPASDEAAGDRLTTELRVPAPDTDKIAAEDADEDEDEDPGVRAAAEPAGTGAGRASDAAADSAADDEAGEGDDADADEAADAGGKAGDGDADATAMLRLPASDAAVGDRLTTELRVPADAGDRGTTVLRLPADEDSAERPAEKPDEEPAGKENAAGDGDADATAMLPLPADSDSEADSEADSDDEGSGDRTPATTAVLPVPGDDSSLGETVPRGPVDPRKPVDENAAKGTAAEDDEGDDGGEPAPEPGASASGSAKPAVPEPTGADAEPAKPATEPAKPTTKPAASDTVPDEPAAAPEAAPAKPDQPPLAKPAAGADRPAPPRPAEAPAPAAEPAPAEPAAGPAVPPMPEQAPPPADADRDPLELLAALTNKPAPPPTPMRTLVRRVKIWTPLAVLVMIIFVVAQSLRPLPEPSLELTASETFTFDGELGEVPWPAQGQAQLNVAGLGSFGSSGEQEPVPIASVAKVMTAYVVLRDHPMEPGTDGAMIPVDQQAEEDAGLSADNESTVEVEAGTELTQREAIEAIMIASANNVARLLARWDAGSEEAFVEKMNEAAAELGMADTVYTDPSGLRPETVSTAADQVRLAEAVMRDPFFREVVRMPNYEDSNGRTHYNWNHLVPMNGVVGIKTGTTTAAGGNLMFAAEQEVGGTPRLIVGAVLAQPPHPSDNSILTGALSAGDALMRFAQAELVSEPLLPAGEVVGEVDDGLGGGVPLVITEDLPAVGWPGLEVRLELHERADGVPGSGAAGTEVGTLAVGEGDERVEVPVALAEDLSEPGFGARLTRIS
ncbi:serine hydrolase [Streptomyces sp. DSM 44915]|uniref:Serine hydrolase n=1 Tax=Streptomyces chisholmiae TaxID=3075540 RepID=A0ABU2JTH5_9ACTN|nr:serine hydrolase [Streptomyces sp. DSM 44915]MDT0268293.1 serine hydrolase [Streptomyces sp. DSM 44915]